MALFVEGASYSRKGGTSPSIRGADAESELRIKSQGIESNHGTPARWRHGQPQDQTRMLQARLTLAVLGGRAALDLAGAAVRWLE